MEQLRALPIRLLPRRWGQTYPLCIFSIVLGVSISFVVAASIKEGRLGLGLWGTLFALLGICGLVTTVLKLLPGSPHYYLELSGDGLDHRRLFRRKTLAWRNLLPFETEHDSEDGVHYVVGYAHSTSSRRKRVVIRISAREYAAKNSEKAAADLARWLNSLRELASRDELDADARVEIPEGIVSRVTRQTMEPAVIRIR